MRSKKSSTYGCADFFGNRERAESNGSIPIRKSQKVIASLFLIFRKKMEQVGGIAEAPPGADEASRFFREPREGGIERFDSHEEAHK